MEFDQFVSMWWFVQELKRRKEKRIQRKKKGKVSKRIKFKKLKKLIPALFLSKTVLVRPRKRDKNFSPQFRSYSTQERKFRKK